MSSNNIYNIRDICINVSNRQKRGVYVPPNIIEKVKLYSKLLLTTEYFAHAFDKDTGIGVKNLILNHINESMSK